MRCQRADLARALLDAVRAARRCNTRAGRSARSTPRSGTSRARRSTSRSGSCSAARATRCRPMPPSACPAPTSSNLCEAARRLVAMGFKCLKTQAGRPGLDHLRGQKPMIEIVRNDARRIKALREALGDEIEIGIDAQCRLDLTHAMELVRLIEPYHVGFFEEPLVQNDVLLMADMRRRTHHADPCRPERGARLPLPRHAAAQRHRRAAAQHLRHRRHHQLRADRGPRLGLQRADQWRRLFLAQHACAGRLSPPAPRSNIRPRR